MTNQHVTTHFHPFTTLPLLQSHLHPKFAIYNAGKKLLEFSQDHYLQLRRAFPRLVDIKKLYAAWLTQPKEEELEDPSFQPPRDDDEEDDDDDGDPKDLDYDDRPPSRQSPPKKRRAPAPRTKSQPMKRKAPAADQPPRKALCSDHRRRGQTSWTNNLIREWSKNPASRAPFSGLLNFQ
jgi:hypothetical protein